MGRRAPNSTYDEIIFRDQRYSDPYELYREAKPASTIAIQTVLGRLNRFRESGPLTDDVISQALYLSPGEFRKRYGSRRTMVDLEGERVDLGHFHARFRDQDSIEYRTFWQRVRRLVLGRLLTAESLKDALDLREADWISYYGGGRHREFTYVGDVYPEHSGHRFHGFAAFLKKIDRYEERSTVWSRLKSGWTMDMALEIPVAFPTERKGTVYRITRKKTGQFYIGITLSSVEQRWSFHRNRAKSGTSKLAAAIREDGEAGFDLDVLEDKIESPEQLKAREDYWVRQLDALGPQGLNMAAPGALSTRPGRPTEVEGQHFRSLKEASEVIGAQRDLAPHVVLKRLSAGLAIPNRARKHSKHPEAGSNLFRRWLGLLKRHPQMVNPTWVESYDQFKADVSPPNDTSLHLVRIDDTKPWVRENVQWVKVQEKMERTHGVALTVGGVAYPSIKALASHFGIGASTLKDRIGRQGMSPEEAVAQQLSATSYRHAMGHISIDGIDFGSKRQAIAYLMRAQGLTEHKAKVLVNKLLQP